MNFSKQINIRILKFKSRNGKAISVPESRASWQQRARQIPWLREHLAQLHAQPRWPTDLLLQLLALPDDLLISHVRDVYSLFLLDLHRRNARDLGAVRQERHALRVVELYEFNERIDPAL